MWGRKRIEIQNQIRAIREALYDVLEVQTIYHTRRDIFIKVLPPPSLVNWKEVATDRLSSLGYSVEFGRLDPTQPAGPAVLHLRRPGERAEANIPWTNIILFLLTVITTLLAGAVMNEANPFSNPLLIFRGVSFALPLLLILTFHEFGHYIQSRINGIKVSLPYFIPGPTLFGTFGAVIRSKSPFKTRRDLLDVGAAGPIAGFVVAIVVIIIGLSHSQIVEETPGEGLILGESLIFRFLSSLVLKDLPQDHTVLLSPTAFAGWAGILVTMLNLLPIGQLDGGHIIYALLGRHQRKVATVVTLSLIPLGYFFWEGWFVWVVLVLLIKIGHPPTLNDQVPLDIKRKVIGWVAMLIFVLSFTPVPIK
ncbi:MAG: site-2 protease family protein [candidate division Zixibacteria bacterium]|nr:site-2 protease family protein [candidate division Zixibacteria bacterium]